MRYFKAIQSLIVKLQGHFVVQVLEIGISLFHKLVQLIEIEFVFLWQLFMFGGPIVAVLIISHFI